MRHLAALFMILASLMAVGQEPRVEAAVVHASSACALERQADGSQQVRHMGDDAQSWNRSAVGCHSFMASEPAQLHETIRLGSDRARE